MQPHSFYYVGACPEMTAPFINYITGYGGCSPEPLSITYRTFARWIDPEFIREWNEPLRGTGITLGNDWAIAFYRASLPSGPRCYYFVWSAMEHVFVPADVRCFDLRHETELAETAGC